MSPLRPLCSGAAGQRASRLAERARRKVRREGGKAERETGDDRGTQSWRVSFTQALALTRQNPVRYRHSHEATRPVPTLGRVLHDNLILRSRFVAPTGSSWLRPQGAGSRSPLLLETLHGLRNRGFLLGLAVRVPRVCTHRPSVSPPPSAPHIPPVKLTPCHAATPCTRPSRATREPPFVSVPLSDVGYPARPSLRLPGLGKPSVPCTACPRSLRQ